MRFKVGDGSRIFLWLDVWHPDGCLLDKYGYRVVYDAASSVCAKLSSIIRNGEWYWPYARSESIVVIQSKLSDVEIGNTDLPFWNCKKGSYVCAETWEALRVKAPTVSWWKVVWNPVAIPRHSFLLWLVFRDALVSKERMCRWGYAGDCLCPFCRSKLENREHLFFKCSFSTRLWKDLMASCLVSNPVEAWEAVVKWSVAALKGDSLKSRLCILSLGAVVCHLWKHRNDLIYGNIPSTEEAILAKDKMGG